MTWTREAIERLGPTTDVPTTASIFGVGEWPVYEAIRRGEWTITRVLRLGRRIRIPTHDLVVALYGAPDMSEDRPPTDRPTAADDSPLSNSEGRNADRTSNLRAV